SAETVVLEGVGCTHRTHAAVVERQDGGAPTATLSRDRGKPRRSVSVSPRRGWGPDASEKKLARDCLEMCCEKLRRHFVTGGVAAGEAARILGARGRDVVVHQSGHGLTTDDFGPMTGDGRPTTDRALIFM